jgi:hypothetical protein
LVYPTEGRMHEKSVSRSDLPAASIETSIQGTVWGALIAIAIAVIDASVTNDSHTTEVAKQYFVNALRYWMFVCIIAGISIDVWRYRRRERQHRELMAKREEMRAQQEEMQALVKQILCSGRDTSQGHEPSARLVQLRSPGDREATPNNKRAV